MRYELPILTTPTKPKPPETNGGHPTTMPYGWLQGLTWYKGGGSIVAFCKEEAAADLVDRAAASGFALEARGAGLVPGSARLTFLRVTA